jgi:hypothetical protein
MAEISLTRMFRATLYAQETEEQALLLVTMRHATLNPPIRLSSDYDGTWSRGMFFVGFPFSLTVPDDTDSGVPQMRLAVDAIDRRIEQFIADIPTSPLVDVEIVAKARPSIVERDFRDYLFAAPMNDTKTISSVLTRKDVSRDRYPSDLYNLESEPGLG